VQRRRRLAVTEAQIKTASANVAQREAALAQARIDLQRTRITSPVNGIVIKRAIEKGQTVAASLQSPELFVIAQNLSDMQVDASIDESDVGRIRTGQKCHVHGGCIPGPDLRGLGAPGAQGGAERGQRGDLCRGCRVLSNTGGRLMPGMTANVRVITDSRENVLKVPNARIAHAHCRGGAGGTRPGAASGASAPAAIGHR
jgi:HlyD family secretion protein